MHLENGDIITTDNVANYSECIKKCNDNKECFIWTYTEGSCWLKNENTFRALSNNVVGGFKECPKGGKILYNINS